MQVVSSNRSFATNYRSTTLGNDLANNIAVDIREATFDAVVAIRELLMVNAQ